MKMKERATDEEIVSALRNLFPDMTKLEGQILWGNVTNKDVYLPNGKDAGSSFRKWGRLISLVTGVGDYLDYYCSYGFVKMIFDANGATNALNEKEATVLKTLSDAGWKIEEMDEDER